MNIRAYQPTDRDACIGLLKSNMPKYFAPAELPEFEQWLDDQHELVGKTNPAEQYYVVEVNNIIIGCGGYYIDEGKKQASLTWGMIHRDLHKQGFGSKFLKYRIDTIKNVCNHCTIILDTSQYSFSFFEKMGFRTIKITKDFYTAGIDRYDMEL
jgi:ribosomal-protein-alanine N-acetyltransferase